jgi:hypothetical protein
MESNSILSTAGKAWASERHRIESYRLFDFWDRGGGTFARVSNIAQFTTAKLFGILAADLECGNYPLPEVADGGLTDACRQQALRTEVQ